MSAFFCRKSAFLDKNSTFTQSNSARSVLEVFLVLFSVFVRKKVTINENKGFTNYASRIWLPDCSKLAINQKKDNHVTIWLHDIIVNFFWYYLVSLVKFSYWSQFHFNIITGSGVMSIFFCKGLTRNLEIGNTPV